MAGSSGSASKTRGYSTGGAVVAGAFAKGILVSSSTSGFLKIQFLTIGDGQAEEGFLSRLVQRLTVMEGVSGFRHLSG